MLLLNKHHLSIALIVYGFLNGFPRTQLNAKCTTLRVLNFVVYKISWISWYASDPRKFHKTILETHVAPPAYTKFNTLTLSNHENFTHEI